MSNLDILLAAAAVFFAYLVRGITGFGSALVAVPLLVQLVPLTFVVPFIATLDVIAALVLTGNGLRDRSVRWSEVGWLLPGSLLGIVVGLQLLVNVNPDLLLTALGLFVVFFGLRSLLGLQGERIISRRWALLAGAAGGGIGAVFSTGGPPYVIYLGHRLRDKAAMRATLSAIFLIDGGFRLIAVLLAGLLWQPHMAWFLLGALPLMGAGLALGNLVHIGLSARQMAMTLGVLLVGSGVSLWLRVWLVD
ncbi:MAG TPA: sulfite exporter TauE/SafE family protein [Gammaproteobacteria bacterium]|nr:sulfite exporter TauE/SafE family protein [Chromatiales bacterium]HPQ24739.1 sulfite exporter TauE/SafE family protein [Gammaproteobacteria bacterium]